MSYYETLDEDLKRARAILDEGRAALDQQLDTALLPQPDVRERLLTLQGGTIYGKDTYVAYKLLESFVDEITRLRTVAAGSQGEGVVARALEPLPAAELRRDERGHLDDVVIPEVKLFRLERMDRDTWWMRLYMPDGMDYVFSILTSGREITITVETDRQ